MAKDTRPPSEAFDGTVGNYGYVVDSVRIAPMAGGKINFEAKVIRVVRYQPAPTEDVVGYPLCAHHGETAWDAAHPCIDEIEAWLKTQP